MCMTSQDQKKMCMTSKLIVYKLVGTVFTSKLSVESCNFFSEVFEQVINIHNAMVRLTPD